MKIIKIDKSISTVDDICVLSKRMRGIKKIESTQPINKTLFDFSQLLSNQGIKWALCGGLSLGLYTRPRGTDDIDIIIENESDIDNVVRITKSIFKKTRDHALVHRQLGVEVELLTSNFINISNHIIQMAINTAQVVSLNTATLPVVSREGLVALKLNRSNTQDIADIESLLKNNDVDVSKYNLPTKQIKILDNIRKRILQ